MPIRLNRDRTPHACASAVSRETLPTDVMNGVMDLHHKLMRKLLVQHGGYESDTEGDSFIVAFATPWDALAFAQVRHAHAQEGGNRALDARELLCVRPRSRPCLRVRPRASSKLAKPQTIQCTRSTAHICARHFPGAQDVQRGLITLPWPDVLLQCEEARPLVAQVGGEGLTYGGFPRPRWAAPSWATQLGHTAGPHSWASAVSGVAWDSRHGVRWWCTPPVN